MPEHKNVKILFVLKKRKSYGISCGPSYGLLNSCKFVAEGLKAFKIDSKIVEVIDGNNIDAEIHKYKPNLVILEAIWCPPAKLDELAKLHKKIKFNVRLHSKLPFLAQEKMAIEWMNDYQNISEKRKNVSLSSNNKAFVEEINKLNYVFKFTPNYYPIDSSIFPSLKPVGEILDIGLFGAIRVLKNHLEQAAAAIHVANKLKKKLHLHINDSSTYEKEGNAVLNNLTHLFKNTKHKLVVHGWKSHDEFIELVKKMDVGMQVSFSETFNIVAADFVTNGVPIVGSPEIEFLSHLYQAKPTDFNDIVKTLEFAITYKKYGAQAINEIHLRKYSRNALNSWLIFVNDLLK